MPLHHRQRIALWGASGNGVFNCKLLKSLDLADIEFFVDSDPAKWGKNLEGVTVRKPSADDLRGVDVICISSCSHVEIHGQLTKMGVDEKACHNVFHYLSRFHADRLNDISLRHKVIEGVRDIYGFFFPEFKAIPTPHNVDKVLLEHPFRDWNDLAGIAADDYYRILKTVDCLEDLDLDGKSIFEMGGPSFMGDILRRIFPRSHFVQGDFDLRYPFPLPDRSVDFVISTEVLEHLQDVDLTRNTGINLSGVKNSLSESHRILAEGGRIFITTPSGCSYEAILAFLKMYWRKDCEHFKELFPPQLKCLLEETNFDILYLRTEEVCGRYADADHIVKLAAFMKACHFPTEDRKSTIFALAQKRTT